MIKKWKKCTQSHTLIHRDECIFFFNIHVDFYITSEKFRSFNFIRIVNIALETKNDYESINKLRGTSLKREGDQFYANTEYSTYVPHEGHHRADLARRPTSLKMEGDMGTTTEQCEKFIEWLNVTRPALARLPTNLKLEGELETTTENLDKYVPFVGARRPELLRQRSSLKLEGDSTFLPEYTDVFRPHYHNGG